MNRKIPIQLATGIILILAISVTLLIWIENKKNIRFSDQQGVIIQPFRRQPVAENKTDTDADRQENIDVPERFSGTDCYKKDNEGNDNKYELREDFNISKPTLIERYFNSEKEIYFEIPYNIFWGNAGCDVQPYIEFERPDGSILIEFGKPRAWITSEFNLTISKSRPLEDIIAEQKNVGGVPGPNPRKKIIGDKNMVVYESYGDGTEKIYEIVGKNYNYSFSYSGLNYLDKSSLASLEKIIASVKIFGTGDKILCTLPPRETAMGSAIYPIDIKYKNLRFLGQLFTADKCGQKRLFEVSGGSNDYSLGSSVVLYENPSQSLVDALADIGFSCAEKISDNACREWHLEKAMKLDDLLRLEPFSNLIKVDDCINCG